MKKAERVAKALAREARREQYAREEAAMQAFLRECRASLPADVWDKEFVAAERSAEETWHVVEWMVFVFADTQHPITPALRQALDTMLDARGFGRHDPRCKVLRYLNYGAYWKLQYGY